MGKVILIKRGLSPEKSILREGLIGPPGPPGPSGAGNEIGEAGENLPIYTAVVSVDGVLVHADPMNPEHAGKVLGVTTISALQGSPTSYKMLGKIDAGMWPVGFLFVGLTGQLVSSPPAGAVWTQRMGVCTQDSSLILNPLPPVIRSL